MNCVHIRQLAIVVAKTHRNDKFQWFWFRNRCSLYIRFLWNSRPVSTLQLCTSLTDWMSFLCEESVLLKSISSLLAQIWTVSHSVNFSVRLMWINFYQLTKWRLTSSSGYFEQPSLARWSTLIQSVPQQASLFQAKILWWKNNPCDSRLLHNAFGAWTGKLINQSINQQINQRFYSWLGLLG